MPFYQKVRDERGEKRSEKLINTKVD